MNQVTARALDNSSWRNVPIVIDVPHAHKTWRAGVPGRRQINARSQILPGNFKRVRRVILVIDWRDEDFSERWLDCQLPGSHDSSVRSRNHSARRNIAIVGASEN